MRYFWKGKEKSEMMFPPNRCYEASPIFNISRTSFSLHFRGHFVCFCNIARFPLWSTWIALSRSMRPSKIYFFPRWSFFDELKYKKDNIGHILLSIFGKMLAIQRLCRSEKCKLLRKWEVKKWECYLLFEIEWTVNGSFYSRGYFHSGKIPHENSWEILLV